MAPYADLSRTPLERAGAMMRRGFYAVLVTLGLLLGFAAGLFGLAVGGDATIIPTCLIAGAAVGWLSAKALIANRTRLARVGVAWLVGRLLPGSRTARLLTAATAVGRGGVSGAD